MEEREAEQENLSGERERARGANRRYAAKVAREKPPLCDAAASDTVQPPMPDFVTRTVLLNHVFELFSLIVVVVVVEGPRFARAVAVSLLDPAQVDLSWWISRTQTVSPPFVDPTKRKKGGKLTR